PGRKRDAPPGTWNPDDTPRTPRLQGKDRGADRSQGTEPLLERRGRGPVGRSRGHRHGRGARRLRLADAAPPRPHESSRVGAAERLAGWSQRPAPERDRSLAPSWARAGRAAGEGATGGGGGRER